MNRDNDDMGTRAAALLLKLGAAATAAGIAAAVLSGEDRPSSDAGGEPAVETPAGAPPTRSGNEVFADRGGHAADVWGAVDCASPDRVMSTGGLRRITLLDGDDFAGERCELGLNDLGAGPTVLYREGERRVTGLSIRLAPDFPLDSRGWQLLLQMKQTQPADNGGGTPVIELDAYEGRWRLRQSTSVDTSFDARELWSTPAVTGIWTEVVLDVTYSAEPSRGSLRVAIDGDGDGRFRGDELSPVFRTYTLKREGPGGGPGDDLDEGDPIPSHLRIGVYHDADIACPGDGCVAEFRDVRVLDPES